MPFTRPRSAADIMSRSLLPTLDGLPFGLNPNITNISNEGFPMSRSSFASFHLTGIKTSSGKVMTSSVDRLFENDADVFHSSNYADFHGLPSIQETASAQSKSPEPSTILGSGVGGSVASITNNLNKSVNIIDNSGRDSPTTTTTSSTAKSSRRDSLTDKIIMPESNYQVPPPNPIPLPLQQGISTTTFSIPSEGSGVTLNR